MQIGGLNDFLQPDAGLKEDGRDAFAKFDECEVRPAVKDPRMPNRSSVSCHHPEVLTWPKNQSPSDEPEFVSVWVYW